ncbi:MAG: glycosyltransferase [Nitrospirota bacterium]
MVTWYDLYSKLYKLKTAKKKYETSLSKVNSIGIITYRLGVDGVANAISGHVKILRTLKKNNHIDYSTLILVTGSIDIALTEATQICDDYYLLPEMGLSCNVSSAFYSSFKNEESLYDRMPEALLAKANLIKNKIKKIVLTRKIEILILENVNSLPYNICTTLALVLLSEEINLPVINICHDFFWEHKESTRLHLFSNENIPEVFGLLNILSPWSSPNWLHVTTTSTGKKWLLDRGWDEDYLETLPCLTCFSQIKDKKSIISVLYEKLKTVLPSEDFFLLNQGFKVTYKMSENYKSHQNSYVFLVPTKISSGKRIDLALGFFETILQNKEFLSTIRSKEFIFFIVAGPLYDVPEKDSHLKRIENSIKKIFANKKISRDIKRNLILLFPLGVSSHSLKGHSMSSLYHEADTVLFFSKRETYGLPIIEAAKYKKPIILTPYEGIHREIYNEITDNLIVGEISANNIKKGFLPIKIEQILNDQDLRNQINIQNNKIIKNRLNFSRLSKDFLRILNKAEKNITTPKSNKTILDFGDLSLTMRPVFQEVEKIWLKSKKPVVVSIAGPAVWGKTNFAKAFIEIFNQQTTIPKGGIHISTDDFGLPGVELKKRGLSFVPESIKVEKLTWSIERLLEGKTIVLPKFVHSRQNRFHVLRQAKSLIILEGLFALWREGHGIDKGAYEELHNLINIKLYIDTEESETFKASAINDSIRGLSSEQILKRQQERIQQFKEYVLTSKRNADFIVITCKGNDFRKIKKVIKLSGGC